MLLEDLENVSVQTAAEDLPHRFLKYLVKRLNSSGIKVDEYKTFDKDSKSRGRFKVPNLLDGITIRTHDRREINTDNRNQEGYVDINVKLRGIKLDISYEVYSNPIKMSLNAASMDAKAVVDAIIDNYESSLKKINIDQGSGFDYDDLKNITDTWNDQESEMITLDVKSNHKLFTSKATSYTIALKPKLFRGPDVDISKYISDRRAYNVILNLLNYQGTKKRIKKDDRITSDAREYYLFNGWMLKIIAARKEFVREVGHAYDFLTSRGLEITNLTDSYEGLTGGFTFITGNKKTSPGLEKQSRGQEVKSKSKMLMKVNAIIKEHEGYLFAQKKRINKHASEHGRYLLKVFFREPEKFL